jgi:hypothetical protein
MPTASPKCPFLHRLLAASQTSECMVVAERLGPASPRFCSSSSLRSIITSACLAIRSRRPYSKPGLDEGGRYSLQAGHARSTICSTIGILQIVVQCLDPRVAMRLVAGIAVDRGVRANREMNASNSPIAHLKFMLDATTADFPQQDPTRRPAGAIQAGLSYRLTCVGTAGFEPTTP